MLLDGQGKDVKMVVESSYSFDRQTKYSGKNDTTSGVSFNVILGWGGRQWVGLPGRELLIAGAGR